MSKTPHSSDSLDHNHDHERGHHHGHSPHDWDSPNYVSNWAKDQDQKEADREGAFELMAETIPYGKTESIKDPGFRRRIRSIDPVSVEAFSEFHCSLPGRLAGNGEAWT